MNQKAIKNRNVAAHGGDAVTDASLGREKARRGHIQRVILLWALRDS